jgi:hypothetical protein
MVARETEDLSRQNTTPSSKTSRLLGRIFTDEQVTIARQMAEEHLPSTITEQESESVAKMREQTGERWVVDSACTPLGEIPQPTTATDEQCQGCPVRVQCLLPAIRTTTKPGLEQLVDVQWSGNYGGTTPQVRAEIATELNAMEES